MLARHYYFETGRQVVMHQMLGCLELAEKSKCFEHTVLAAGAPAMP